MWWPNCAVITCVNSNHPKHTHYSPHNICGRNGRIFGETENKIGQQTIKDGIEEWNNHERQ